jgi:hypothetical protein
MTAAYLHTCIRACPEPRHTASYARIIHAGYARRTLREHALRLDQAASDPTLPNPTATVAERTSALDEFLDGLAHHVRPHPGPLPRTPLPETPQDATEEALEDERLLLASATAHPGTLKQLRLKADDFLLPLQPGLYRRQTGLAHRGDQIDPVTVLREAQHRRLLTARGWSRHHPGPAAVHGVLPANARMVPSAGTGGTWPDSAPRERGDWSPREQAQMHVVGVLPSQSHPPASVWRPCASRRHRAKSPARLRNSRG